MVHKPHAGAGHGDEVHARRDFVHMEEAGDELALHQWFMQINGKRHFCAQAGVCYVNE